jgi:hypothetical protein|uniref:Isopropylmalate dehydrogenase-like domain-containing protein n=1 Tax=Eutreptiella gymnastica TaxID=73025 RepID=A0A7S4GIV7_9EUGL|mmetsp:Transcript_58373/g.96772  ORF Transcript_58373/g.96772 Transcript_58373/m.96772 type:complete len:345 (-) Transcript_58373:78-1112(-)|eukprot:CAMPEP_0174284602 /NCGR_PEP_ID=MMETSP0809-20121228/6149_1 /TAXON_ID=73025 ORGANISM="Eutreptiella gymnastica-like, Strain CCMP1594" /NCGR_SAMPLE_ID=MMETSP0809 /ASSEMBLY_ACC=CAM_ASM_000658 /LENGTH=344 /DNA_ID=CAMNT_0015380157 /DNA_START=32 /DNA_END=1066 /DNA_ORIENTATION=-
MASTVPFVASSALGEKLLGGLQKVLTAAKAPVSLVKTDANAVAASATHILAGPLNPVCTGELANKFALSTKVTKAAAADLYPNTIYPALGCEAVQNLYALSNPDFVSSGGASHTDAVVKTKEQDPDGHALKLLELQKEQDRSIQNFFNAEAKTSLQETLKMACDKALESKVDKKTVTVVSKPGDKMSSKFDELFAGVVKSETDSRADELRAASVSVEVTPVGSAWPKMVMYPESTQLLVCPPTEAGEEMATLFIGLAGGTGMVSQKLSGGASVYTCANYEDNENPTGALLAACDLLTDMGHEAEAKKVRAALDKTYKTDKILPKDMPGGKADLNAFIEAVAKNC